MKLLLVMLFCVLLQACTSAPDKVNYYLLHTAEEANLANKPTQSPKIVLAKIILADYLRQNRLVLQVNKNQLYYSALDIWAENLEAGISKALLTDLNQQTGNYQYMRYAAPDSESASYELIVEMEHFLATNDSKVIGSGNYWLIDKTSGKHIFSDKFYLRSDLTKDGYVHAVEQLRALLYTLSQKINEEINNIPKQH
ncbi:MAG: putative lipoprotein YmbA [Paraglaciecola sp.]|jgi:uncharacterized lipoprotein YmbA